MLLREGRRCERCGCYLSRFAAPHERYCIVCEPRPEPGARRRQVCAQGHHLHLYAVRNGQSGKVRCVICARERRP